jgi:hypothetical protein
MSKANVKHARWVTRYNLTIAFEELYTEDDAELHASANAIGDVVSAIEQLISTDPGLRTMLQLQNLKLNIVSPDRAAKRQVGDGSGDRKRSLSHI